MKIYIVKSITGESEDYEERIIKAVQTREEAEQLIKVVTQPLFDAGFYISDGIKSGKLGYIIHDSQEAYDDFIHPMYPKFHCDYTGIKYEIDEMETMC